MIGSRLVSCLNKLWQIYPCKYIPRYASGCSNPECKNPKCPGKADPCCCPPPVEVDPCSCSTPQPEAPCPCPPTPNPCCCPPPTPCVSKDSPCAPKPPACPPPKCPKKPTCPPKPPCCPPKPKTPPCPPKPSCPKKPKCSKDRPCTPKPPCCPPSPCKKKPPCPKPTCPPPKPKCPPPPCCPPEPCPPPRCPPKPSCPKDPPCPSKPPPWPKQEPPCPCPPKPCKTRSSPSCSKDLSNQDVDRAARELCIKAIETCAEARKILDFYRCQKVEAKEIEVKASKSCQIKSSSCSCRGEGEQKRKSRSGSPKEKSKQSQTSQADSVPKIYNSSGKKFNKCRSGCTCTKKHGGAGSCNCPHCKNGQTRNMSSSKSIICDENCPHRNKVGCVCTCIKGINAKFNERLANELKALTENKTLNETCPKCKTQQCNCSKSQSPDVKPKTVAQIYSHGKKRIGVSTVNVTNSGAQTDRTTLGSASQIKIPNIENLLVTSQGPNGSSSTIANGQTSVVGLTKTEGSNQKVSGTESNCKYSLNKKGACPFCKSLALVSQTKIDGVPSPRPQSKSSGEIKIPNKQKSRIPCTKRVLKTQREEVTTFSKSKSDATCQVELGKKGRSGSESQIKKKIQGGEFKVCGIKSQISCDKGKKCESACSVASTKGRPGSESQMSKAKNKESPGSKNIVPKGTGNQSGTDQKVPDIKSCDKVKNCDASCPLGKDTSRPCTCIKSQKAFANSEVHKRAANSNHKLSVTKSQPICARQGDNKFKTRNTAICPLCRRGSKICTCKHARKKSGSDHKLPDIKSCEELIRDKVKTCDGNCPLGKDKSRPCTCFKSQKAQIDKLAGKKSGSNHKLSVTQSQPICAKKDTFKKGLVSCPICKKGSKTCTCKHAKEKVGSDHKLGVNKITRCESSCPLGKGIKSESKQTKSEQRLTFNKTQPVKSKKASPNPVCGNCKKEVCTCKHESQHKLATIKSQESYDQLKSCLIGPTCPLCKENEKDCKCLESKSQFTFPKHCSNVCPLCKKEETSCKCLQSGPYAKQIRKYSKLTHVQSNVKVGRSEEKMNSTQSSSEDDMVSKSKSKQKLITIQELLTSQKLDDETKKKLINIQGLLSSQEKSKKSSETCLYRPFEKESVSLYKLATIKSEDSITFEPSYSTDEDPTSKQTLPTVKSGGSFDDSSSPCEEDGNSIRSKLEAAVSKISCTKDDDQKLITIKSLLSSQKKSMINAGICPECKNVANGCTCEKSEKPLMYVTLRSGLYPKLSRSYHKLIKPEESETKSFAKLTQTQYKLHSIKLQESSEKFFHECQKKEKMCTCLQLKQSLSKNMNHNPSKIFKKDYSTSKIIETSKEKQSWDQPKIISDFEKEPQKFPCSCCKSNLVCGTDSATPCPKCQKASKACIEFLSKKNKRLQGKSKLSIRASYPCSNVSNPFYRTPPSTILCNHQQVATTTLAAHQRLGVNFSSISRFSSKCGCGGSDSSCKNEKPKCPKKPECPARMPGPRCPPSLRKKDPCSGPSYVIKEPKCDLLCELQNVFRDQTPWECKAINQYYGDCYQNKEYHMYHKNTFHELQNYMEKYRNRQPSNKNKMRSKPPCCG